MYVIRYNSSLLIKTANELEGLSDQFLEDIFGSVVDQDECCD